MQGHVCRGLVHCTGQQHGLQSYVAYCTAWGRACTRAALNEVTSKQDELRLIQHAACPKYVHGFLHEGFSCCRHQMVRVQWLSPNRGNCTCR